MADLVWLIPAFPLAGFLLILLFGRRLGDPRSGYLATAMVFASFVVAAAIYFDLIGRAEEDRSTVVTLFSWVPVGTLQVDLNLPDRLGAQPGRGQIDKTGREVGQIGVTRHAVQSFFSNG